MRSLSTLIILKELMKSINASVRDSKSTFDLPHLEPYDAFYHIAGAGGQEGKHLELVRPKATNYLLVCLLLRSVNSA